MLGENRLVNRGARILCTQGLCAAECSGHPLLFKGRASPLVITGLPLIG